MLMSEYLNVEGHSFHSDCHGTNNNKHGVGNHDSTFRAILIGTANTSGKVVHTDTL